jgi:hypothetical protein
MADLQRPLLVPVSRFLYRYGQAGFEADLGLRIETEV